MILEDNKSLKGTGRSGHMDGGGSPWFMQPIFVKNRDIGNYSGQRVDVIGIYTDHRRSEKKR